MIIGYMILFFFGLIFGYYLNGCILRIAQGKFLVSHSSRSCQQKKLARYFLVELITGMVPVTLYIKYGLSIDFYAFIFLKYILIVIFFIDLEHQIIPNELVIIAMLGGALLFFYNLYRPFQIYADHVWWNPLLGLVSGSGFLLAVSLIGSLLYKTEEVMGMGDVKLFAPIGLFLGWRMTLLALFLSVVLGGMTSLILILLGKATRKSTIPFGPFIVIAVFLTIMWGWDIASWYLQCFWYY